MTLIIDTGMNIVGVYSVEEKTYTPYLGSSIADAIKRIQQATEIVTYSGFTKNGEDYDLLQLGKFAGLSGELQLNATYTDMRKGCWSDQIIGSNLFSTYSKNFINCPSFPDTYEGSNERDVYMTFKLWELWKEDRLKVLGGNYL